MSLGSQVPEEQGVHGALKTDVQLSDLSNRITIRMTVKRSRL